MHARIRINAHMHVHKINTHARNTHARVRKINTRRTAGAQICARVQYEEKRGLWF